MTAYQDLLKDTSVAIENGNYFLVTVTDLELNKNYPIQFRWKLKDGTYGLWSASKLLTTPGETLPGSPNLSISDVIGGAGFIKVTWNGNDGAGRPITNVDRVDIYIEGLPFDSSKPAASFKTAGTQTIVAPAGDYIVALYAVSNYGTKSAVSSSRFVTVTSVGETVLSPEDPDIPVVTAGLASVIVEWNGKKLDENGDPVDFTKGSFAGAKVFIGTTSNFTPNDNNWVHTLNFANGSNKVSIGVGTIIDKSNNTLLQYNTPYYVKIDTINANGVANGNPVAADGNPITVNRLPASEIEAGILRADAYIQAGPNGGQRTVISGGQEPFVIYGSDGTTKLLEFDSLIGGTGALKIIGSGSFSGDISAATGTLTNALRIGTPTGGLYPFSVSSSGVLRAVSGQIAGWTLADSYFQNSSGTFKISSQESALFLGDVNGSHIRITPNQIAHYNGGSTSNKFTLTTSTGNLTLSGDITGSNITGSSFTIDAAYNKWDSTKFIVGDANTQIYNIAGEGKIVLYSGILNESTSVEIDTESGDTGGSATAYVPVSKIELTQGGIAIQNIPGLGNGLTASNSLEYNGSGAPNEAITQYRAAGYVTTGNGPSYNYGKAARYRMIIADPYDDNKLKRGLGIYYGVRSGTNNPPSYTTGSVGDLWISW